MFVTFVTFIIRQQFLINLLICVQDVMFYLRLCTARLLYALFRKIETLFLYILGGTVSVLIVVVIFACRLLI